MCQQTRLNLRGKRLSRNRCVRRSCVKGDSKGIEPVKWTMSRGPKGKPGRQIAEARKLEKPTGLDTPVVPFVKKNPVLNLNSTSQ